MSGIDVRLSSNPTLATGLFDLAESLLRWSRAYWRFWEGEERAYAHLYAEVLLELVRAGDYDDLDTLMLSLSKTDSPGEPPPTFNLRLLSLLRSIRKESNE